MADSATVDADFRQDTAISHYALRLSFFMLAAIA